ncbi:MAG: SAVED domain-containing protein [Bacillota bacterium]
MEPDDVVPLLERLRHQRVAIIRQGATAIHLFYAGPVAVAAMIGAELSNGCPVHVYHYNSGEGRYVNWGLLDWADSPAAI